MLSLSWSNAEQADSDVGHAARKDVNGTAVMVSFPFALYYGSNKIHSGVTLIVAGAAADVTGVGALLGVPAQTLGAYQLATSPFRLKRGITQLNAAAQDPWTCKSPLRYGADIGLDVAPGGGSIENY